jgi:hypothetical protein
MRCARQPEGQGRVEQLHEIIFTTKAQRAPRTDHDGRKNVYVAPSPIPPTRVTSINILITAVIAREPKRPRQFHQLAAKPTLAAQVFEELGPPVRFLR